MTGLTRRAALHRAAVVVAAAATPSVVQAADPEETQVLAVFRQLDDRQRAVVHMCMRCLARLPADPALEARCDRDRKPVREVGS